MGILQVAGECLILEFCYGFAGLQVIVDEVFSEHPEIKRSVRKIKSGLEREQGLILQSTEQGVDFYRIGPVFIKSTTVIGNVGPKSEIAFITQFNPIGIVCQYSIVTDGALTLCVQTKSKPCSIVDTTTIAQEIGLVIIIKIYRLVSMQYIKV